MAKEKILNKHQLKYMVEAFNYMYCNMKDDIETLSKNPDDAIKTWLWNYLPPTGRGDLDIHLAFKLLVTIITVAFKFRYNKKFLLANRAEEIVLYIVMEVAKELAEAYEDRVLDYTDFFGTYFDDMDFYYLYQPEYDGIDGSVTGDQMGIGSLAVKDWFTPFNNDRKPHPFFLKGKNRLKFKANVIEYDEEELEK